MPQHRQTVLVTGAGGDIGSRICGGLSREFDLILTDTKVVADKDPQLATMNLLNYDAVRQGVQGVDMILHLAIASTRDFSGRSRQAIADAEMQVNVMGTQHLFAAAHEAGVRRVVYMSSMTIDLGWPPRRSFATDTPARPTCLYACTKLFGEQLGELYARQHGMSMICLRLGQPFPVEDSVDAQHLRCPGPAGSWWRFRIS